jgi:hypothetical protein
VGYDKDPGKERVFLTVDGGDTPFGEGIIEMCWQTDRADRGGDIEFISSYLRENSDELLDGITVDEIEKYVPRIKDYELAHPPRPLLAEEEVDM